LVKNKTKPQELRKRYKALLLKEDKQDLKPQRYCISTLQMDSMELSKKLCKWQQKDFYKI